MTRTQHEATRARRLAEADWLRAYGWTQGDGSLSGSMRWKHPSAPKASESYSQRDAINITDAEPLRYNVVR